MTYDTNDQLIATTDGEGNRNEKTYYSGGRIQEDKYYDSKNELIDDIQYTYDDAIENGTLSKEKIQTKKRDLALQKIHYTKQSIVIQVDTLLKTNHHSMEPIICQPINMII